MLRELLGRLSGGENLSQEESAAAFEAVLRGECSDAEIALLLMALRTKGETADEIAGAAATMQSNMVPILNRTVGAIDTCGTGGDGSATFNISTAAAIVTAAAGVPVAKHGNRKVTSRSGSADVLAALGVNVEADVATVEACLEELGLCFCFAPLLHPTMKRVAEVRRQLGGRTIFNLLGPLSNPARAPFRLLGVGKPEFRPILANALLKLGVERAIVVHGEDGLDEVTTCGRTFVTEVKSLGDSQSPMLIEHVWTPSDFGVPLASRDAFDVSGPEESAAVIRNVLANQPGPALDITAANAAAAIWTAGKVNTLGDGMNLALNAISSGAASELLARLVQRSLAV